VIQFALLAAVQAHSALHVTLIVPGPPAASIVCAAGLIDKEPAIPACVTVRVRPATATVPVRGLELLFAATV
jgi:hypothetical protein